MRLHHLLVPLLASLLSTAHAAQPGERLPAFSLPDQQGAQHTLSASVKRIYYTRDMAGGKLMKAVLVEKAQQRLDAQAAVAVADVSGMPAPIRSMMALPALKKRPYTVWIDEAGSTAAVLPQPSDSVVVVDVQDMTITQVRYAKTEEELNALLPPMP